MTDRELTHQFIVTSQKHRKTLDASLDETGMHRGQHRVLMTLSCKDIHTQVELAKELEVAPATIAVSLKGLEKDGYVERGAKEGDNRAKQVFLTDKGRKLVEGSKKFFETLDQQMYLDFSQEEKDLFQG
nr:MarR family transcriptional regulator [Eubacterium sp.]